MLAVGVLESITVENFRSWVKGTIHLAGAGGLTVLVGNSRSGKSNIAKRALGWVYDNEPSGTEYIRVGATFARVTLKYDNGTVVIRERGKRYNRYILVVPGQEQQVFEGFGSNVPLEIQEVTGVRPVTIGDLQLHLNISGQLEGPFLGSSVSAPTRAKVLGKLAGTEEIDYAGKQLASDLHNRKEKCQELTSEVAGLDARIAEYDYLPGMAEKIERLEVLVATVKALRERQKQLEALTDRLKMIDTGIAEAALVLNRWRHLEALENTWALTRGALEQQKQLGMFRDKLRLINERITEAQGVIARWRHLEALELTWVQAEKTMVRQQMVKGYAGTIARCDGEIGIADMQLQLLHGIYEAENIRGTIEGYIQRLQFLQRVHCRLAEAETSSTAARQTIAQTARLPEAETLLSQVAAARERGAALSQAGRVYRQASLAVKQHTDIAARYAGVEEAGRQVSVVVNLQERQGRLVSLVTQISQCDTQIRSARKVSLVNETQVAELSGAYRDALVAAKICPTCGSEVDLEQVKQVI